MSTSYVVMFIVAALVIVGDLIYELVRKPDDKASLSDLFDDCAQLPQEAIERAQAAGIKPTLIQVRTPPTENEREWGCNAAKVWLADNGLYMAGYNPEDQHHTAHIYRRRSSISRQTVRSTATTRSRTSPRCGRSPRSSG